MDASEIAEFRKAVWGFYWAQGRHSLPWRAPEADGRFDPYKVLVSEVMLQQTQVSRVIPKYQKFLVRFPNMNSLARAGLHEVLVAWNGLGYNRRAKFLWQATAKLERDFRGTFPQGLTDLQKLPGVGPNTAGAIAAYAFNRPAIFIETNIRTVFIHHFFKGRTNVADNEILALVERTFPGRGTARLWYWALMDYGSHLKQTAGNTNRTSKSYNKQSKFAGSNRQLRGQVIRRLLAGPADKKGLGISDQRLGAVLVDLAGEGLIQKVGQTYSLFARGKTVLK